MTNWLKTLFKDKPELFFIFFIICISLYLYVFNLSQTYWFFADFARDTLKALRILNTHELTLIGPPMSFGQYGNREVYFGSISYYLGAFGLLITGKNVIGPVIVNSLLMTIGIPAMYWLSFILLKSKKLAIFSTILFALSPLTVAHMRFYWNPNYTIPLAPIFFLFHFICLHKSHLSKNSLLFFSFSAGFIAAILANLHYFTLIFTISALLILFRLSWKRSIIWIMGFVTGSIPLIIFELRNNFYLSSSLIHNIFITNNHYLPRSFIDKYLDSFRFITIFIGLDHEATHIPTLFDLPLFVAILIGIIIFVYVISNILVRNDRFIKNIGIIYFIGLSLSSLLSNEQFYARYALVGIPLLSILLVFVLSKTHKYILLSIITFQLIISCRIIFDKQIFCKAIDSSCKSAPLSVIAKVSELIRIDNPTLSYNITENIVGDARAQYLRFYLERDATVIPEKEEVYDNLSTLYVFTTSFERTKKENRWEFYATKNLELTKTWDIKEYKLLRLDSTDLQKKNEK